MNESTIVCAMGLDADALDDFSAQCSFEDDELGLAMNLYVDGVRSRGVLVEGMRTMPAKAGVVHLAAHPGGDGKGNAEFRAEVLDELHEFVVHVSPVEIAFSATASEFTGGEVWPFSGFAHGICALISLFGWLGLR